MLLCLWNMGVDILTDIYYSEVLFYRIPILVTTLNICYQFQITSN